MIYQDRCHAKNSDCAPHLVLASDFATGDHRCVPQGFIPGMLLLALPAAADADQPNTSRTPAIEHDEAGWAGWDAQAKLM